MNHVVYYIPDLFGSELFETDVPNLVDHWQPVTLHGTDYSLHVHTDPDTGIGLAALHPLPVDPENFFTARIRSSVSDIPDDDEHCPRCGAGDDKVSWDGDREFGNGEASNEARCSSCGCRWVNVYTFTRNELLN